MKIEKVNGFWVPKEDRHFDIWAQGSQFTQHKCLDKFLFWCESQHKTFKGVVDIGAWCGTWTRAIEPFAKKIYAFEPHPTHYHCLEKNIFTMIQKVEPMQYALGDKPRQTKMITSDHTQEARIDESQTGVTTMQTLDSFEYKDIDLIKIDVEGYEMKVLEGAQKTLENCQYLMIELNNNSKKYGSNNQQIEKWLHDKGWRVLIDLWPDKVYCK